MEVKKEQTPQSWLDYNMNWEDPDPGNFVYYAAIREAIIERAGVVDYTFDQSNLNLIRPGIYFNINYLDFWSDIIYQLSHLFVNATPASWSNVIDSYPVEQPQFAKARLIPGCTLNDAKTWLLNAKNALDSMRYVYLDVSNVTIYSKSSSKTITRYSDSSSADQKYQKILDALQSDFNSSEWKISKGNYSSTARLSATFEEDYSRGGSTKIEVTSSGSFSAASQKRTYLLRSSLVPDFVGIYAKFPEYTYRITKKIFDAKQAFPNDQIEENKVCKITNYQKNGFEFDFSPALKKFPSFPDHDQFDYTGMDEALSDFYTSFYTDIYQYVELSDIKCVADYFSEDGFKFKIS